LVSEGCDDRVEGLATEHPAQRDSFHQPQTWLAGAPLPSKEVLLTLLWALRVEERKMILGGLLPNNTLSPNPMDSTSAPPKNIVITVFPKRKRVDEDTNGSGKRFQLA